MEIRASSVYDLNTITAFTRMSMFKRTNTKKYMRLFLIFDIIVMAMTVASQLVIGFEFYLCVMLGILLLLLLLYLYMYFLFPKISYKALGKFAGSKNNYVFYDDGMSVSSEGVDFSGNSFIKYTVLYKIMETNEYFYFFQNKTSAFIVDKSSLQNGTADDIREKLLPVFRKKYIICK